MSIGNGALSGQAVATVFRPINLSKSTDLGFGRVVRPTTTTSTVVVDAATGSRTISGGNGALAGGTATNAGYTITGEGGQVVSVNVPASFTMTGPGTLTVTTSKTISAVISLGGGLGTGASYSFGVGGSLPVSTTTPTGAYSGTFTVTVQYN